MGRGGGAEDTDELKFVSLSEDKAGRSGRMTFIEMRQKRSTNELK